MTAYAAHVVTSDAEALGSPEVLVMTQADETGAAVLIERWPLVEGHGDEAAATLREHGYRVDVSTHAYTDHYGYWIWDVEKG